jgi:hypothetical protein
MLLPAVPVASLAGQVQARFCRMHQKSEYSFQILFGDLLTIQSVLAQFTIILFLRHCCCTELAEVSPATSLMIYFGLRLCWCCAEPCG